MSPQIYALLVDATLETLFMVGVSGLAATALGLPLGVALAVTGRGDLLPCPLFHRVVGVVINATRSTPFIILMVAIIPFTRLVTGTSIGPRAAIVPLIVAATPFIARVVDAAVRSVEVGLIEAAVSMGASPAQIIVKVLLPEAFPAIILGLTLAIVSLIGYSAMVGAVGGGGLGDLGIRYGYQRFQPEMMAATVAALIVLVQLVQTIGEKAARRMDRRRASS